MYGKCMENVNVCLYGTELTTLIYSFPANITFSNIFQGEIRLNTCHIRQYFDIHIDIFIHICDGIWWDGSSDGIWLDVGVDYEYMD